MEGENMNYIVIFYVIIAVLGVYLMYSAWKMKKTGEINTAMASSEEVRKCRNKAGFIARIYKPTLVLGLVSLAFGVFSFVNYTVLHLSRTFEICGMLVFLIVCFWFSKELRVRKAEYF